MGLENEFVDFGLILESVFVSFASFDKTINFEFKVQTEL